MSYPKLASGRQADITLVLEGTYPFVSGGVSSWVHQIIRGLPEIAFALVFVGGSREKYEKMRYALPSNVVHLEDHYLAESPHMQRVLSRKGDEKFYMQSEKLHDAFAHEKGATYANTLASVATDLVSDPKKHEHDFLFSERSWDAVCQRYEKQAKDLSFLDYFWSVRSMHAPLFVMARAAAHLPPSRAFHVISTGFAGFLALLASHKQGKPLILTEHGIYTKERRIELFQANWIQDDDSMQRMGIGYFRHMWIRFFEAIGEMTYQSANPILALYEGNRLRQIRDGAPRERTKVVPNGIDLLRFAPLREKRERSIPKVLGLIGRVVPIKDIKTFIRTLRVVRGRIPDVEGWIVGPEDEDPNYAEECHDLVRTLDLESTVKFLGFQNVTDILPKLGLNILTSISEAQPLVILEGFAAGVPCVASDVGCCRELIEGNSSDDRHLGSAGAVVGIADPEATGAAAIALLGNEERWYAAQRAGIERVERYYTQDQMLHRYRAIYQEALSREKTEQSTRQRVG